MNRLKVTVLALVAILSQTLVAATSRDISLAVEDAARSTVRLLAADSRVKDIRSIAFVRLNLPEGAGALALDANVSQTFEATLVSKPEAFSFVTHATHAVEWKLIDGIFDQASDFLTYDPKTHPALNRLKLADALLFGQVLDCATKDRTDRTVDWSADRIESLSEISVRIALRLIKVSTGEQIWGQVVTGVRTNCEVRTERDIRQNLTDEAKDYINLTNILLAVGCLVGLIFVFILFGKMTRVR